MKRKMDASKLNSISERKMSLLQAVDHDVILGLKMAQDVRTSVQVCATRIRDVRKMHRREQELVLKQNGLEEIEDLHREMADVLAEIRARADDIDTHFDELDAGCTRVRRYWFKQLQTDLMLAANDAQLERQRLRHLAAEGAATDDNK